MRRIVVTLDVGDEDHEAVAQFLESSTKRIVYNHPTVGIRWSDLPVKPMLVVPLRPSNPDDNLTP